ncbi:hypothetical protein MVEN_02568200 [Mycena venus]|uniref:Uncharacterized protein n=1 Tax=Mycena venus TaxID=2733690 RepID=A0A8H6WTP6_9AGAR|nr:hypothetical protein MVEN_02568200 [Mycena venus]
MVLQKSSKTVGGLRAHTETMCVKGVAAAVARSFRPSPSALSRALTPAIRFKGSAVVVTLRLFPAAFDRWYRTIRGWEDPSIDDVIQIWNDVFPDYAVSTEDPRDNQLVLVITKLAQDKVDGWRNKLGTAGVAVWKQQFLGMSKEKIIEEVEGYLAGSDRSRVFNYRDVERDDTTGNIKYKGMFQNPAFSRLVGIHCLATTVDGQLGPLAFDPNDPSTCPEGAVTLLKRGLNYFRTGELVIPPGSNGKFSKTNWADRVDFSEGVRKVIPSTSTIAAVVGKLKPAHWTKIIPAAQAAALQRDDTPAVAVIDVDADPMEEDFDLVDDDSDA